MKNWHRGMHVCMTRLDWMNAVYMDCVCMWYVCRCMCNLVHYTFYCVWECVCVCQRVRQGEKKSQDESEREGHFPFPHIIKPCPLTLFSSFSNDSASFSPLPSSFLSLLCLSVSSTLASSPLCQVANVFQPTKSWEGRKRQMNNL